MEDKTLNTGSVELATGSRFGKTVAGSAIVTIDPVPLAPNRSHVLEP